MEASGDLSVSLSAERDRIQRQVEELEQSLSATHPELELLSSETGDESDGDDSEEEVGQSAAGLLAQREKIQNEIQNLENVLGPHSVSDDSSSSSSEESELGLSPSADSCLQMNLVYQQVVQETLDQLETLLTLNHRQQKELVSQLSGPIKEPPRERPAPSSCQLPINMYLGRFLKPYFKDKLTGLGPPANQETKEKASRMTGCLDDKKLKVKRWESWQKTLLIHSVTRDSLRRLIQPKLSKVDYLSQKLSRSAETDRQQLRQQIDSLEREIDLLRGKKETELIGGDRFEEHDWQKISNIDFEGTREAEDIRSFWQNFLHPSINKTQWSKEEVQRLKEISRRHQERQWDTIAAELGTGRTAFLCLQTFQRFVSDSLKRGGWTSEEDALLRELVDKMRIGNFIPYTQMSYFMEGRDPAQLIYRWNQVLDPSLKRGFWTKEEDQLLLQAVSRYGEKDWWKIRFEVPGRTDSGCRDRYYDCLKVETKRGPFDQQEKDLLQQLVEKHGVGRWSKIAAEIPNRYDAQCLREWRKLNKPAPPPRAKKVQKREKPPVNRGGAKRRRRKASPVKKRIRRRLLNLKEEEESSEDEAMVVEYMDSDEEDKKGVVEVERTEEEKGEEQEKEYTFPPMREWIPEEKAQCFSFLSFRPVELFSSGAAGLAPVRSTILGRFGRSVIIGPSPRELRWEERHSSSTMMLVSPDQLRAHLHRQAENLSSRRSGPGKRVQMDKRSPLGRVSDTGLGYELQAAVTPWIGNLLIPPKTRLTAVDALRERGEKTRLASTPVFLLLLQTMSVDSMGCKEMIEQRKNKVVSVVPPPPSRLNVQKNSVAGILQRRRAMKEEMEAFDLQHKQILKQLQALQQQKKQKQQILLLQRPPAAAAAAAAAAPPAAAPPAAAPAAPPSPAQNRPSILLQMPPNMRPQMPPMSFPRAVFVPHPASSVQLLNAPPPVPHRPPPPVGVSSSPIPGPHGPPVSVVPVPLNATSTSSTSFHREALPSTQNHLVTPSPSRHGSVSSTPPSAPSVPAPPQPIVPTPPIPTKHHLASSPSSLPAALPNDHDYTSSNLQPGRPGFCRKRGEQPSVASSQEDQCEDGTGTGVVQRGKRVRNPTQRARALQEASQAKTEAKKKRTSSPFKKRSRTSGSKQEVIVQTQPVTQLPGFCLLPGQSMWIMTPGGLVQLAQAPPQGLQLALVPSAPLSFPPGSSSSSPSVAVQPAAVMSVPVSLPALNRPHIPSDPSTGASKPLPPTFILQPVSNPGFTPLPPPKLFLPYKGTVRADPAVPPPLRRETLQFDPHLMFLESREAVRDWLSGRGGVVVPGLGLALPYLPPFISSLSTLSALLRSKKSLTKSSLQLLSRGSEPSAKHDSSSDRTSSQPPDLPDSTSDLRPAQDTPAPSVSCDLLQVEEEELVAVTRQLVAERFSGNPAYQLLKARFLSCFTVPALLATVQPVTEKTVSDPTNEEEEEEEEEVELKKIRERGRQRIIERSLLLCDGSGAPASHFLGISTSTPGPGTVLDQTGPDRT